MATKLSYAGIYPPISTPFGEDGEVHVAALKENISQWARTGLAGLVVLGSNGEFPMLDDDERDAIIAAVMEAAPRQFKIIVGTGRESTRATIKTTRRAAELGAHAAIVVNPSYYMAQMTDPVLYDHNVAVADASPIPVLLYNAPPFTGVNLGASLVARLAQHPNIVGVKDTGGNIVQIADIARQTSPDFALLAGSASFLLASLAVGAQGGIMALANLAPEECVQIQTLFDAGQGAEARALQLRMLPVNAAVTSRWGQAGLKAAMDMRGYVGGDPRRPQRPLGEEQRAEMKSILAKAGLL